MSESGTGGKVLFFKFRKNFIKHLESIYIFPTNLILFGWASGSEWSPGAGLYRRAEVGVGLEPLLLRRLLLRRTERWIRFFDGQLILDGSYRSRTHLTLSGLLGSRRTGEYKTGRRESRR